MPPYIVEGRLLTKIVVESGFDKVKGIQTISQLCVLIKSLGGDVEHFVLCAQRKPPNGRIPCTRTHFQVPVLTHALKTPCALHLPRMIAALLILPRHVTEAVASTFTMARSPNRRNLLPCTHTRILIPSAAPPQSISETS